MLQYKRSGYFGQVNTPMDYSVFIDQTLTKYNIPFHAEFSAYMKGHHQSNEMKGHHEPDLERLKAHFKEVEQLGEAGV